MFLFYYFVTDVSLLDLNSTQSANVATQQNQQGIATDVNTNVMVTIDVDLNITLCTSSASAYLCFFVDAHVATSSFRDDALQNNVKCIDVSAIKVCSPGKLQTRNAWRLYF